MPDDGKDNKEQALRGVVLCSTSLSQELRNGLSSIASTMGAIHRLDLTADVTHLIVGDINTPKYKHTAKERPDIYVLRPEWIHAVRTLYCEAQSISVEALNQEYRLPALYKLHICVTGFEDIDQRQNLIKSITDNGAKYHGDLTRDVTHLIVARPKGAKYERAKAWNLNIVGLKWLEESLERGMAVDESLYHPLMPSEDQGQGAFVRGYVRPPILGKRPREDAATISNEEAGKRKLRRTASAKLANHSQNMMTSFLSVGGDQELENDNDQWTESKDNATELKTSRDVTPSTSVHDIARPASRGPAPLVHEERGLFSRILCLVHGHDGKKTAKINEIVGSNGGQLAQSTNDLSSALDNKTCDRVVLVLPSEWTSMTKGSLPEVCHGTWLVTEWWLERCIKQKTILNPDEDILSRPHLDLPIDGFQRISIATSGMGHDVLHVSRVIKLAGASYDQTLVPKTSVLVIPALTANSEKISYATKHKVPVVSEKWLFSCLSSTKALPMCEYAMTPHSRDVDDPFRSNRPPSAENNALHPKDKRKDESLAQRLSVTRTRSMASSLHLYKSGPVRPVTIQKLGTSNKGPFIEEEEVEEERDTVSNDEKVETRLEVTEPHNVLVDDPAVSLAGDDAFECYQVQQMQPLQDVPPEVNAARRHSTTLPLGDIENRSKSSENQIETHHKPGSAGSVVADENIDVSNPDTAEANRIRLSGEIKLLLERQHSLPSTVESMPKGRWRKEKRLGRAPSMTSNSSTSMSFPRTASMDIVDMAAPTNLAEVEVPVPSQQLTYETPDAQEYRMKMSKKMGTLLKDDSIGTRVESPGLVRDVDTSGSTGVGSRVRGRNRSAKNPA